MSDRKFVSLLMGAEVIVICFVVKGKCPSLDKEEVKYKFIHK